MSKENKINLRANVGLRGRYRLRVRKRGEDTPRVDTGWFDNLITNDGLDALGDTDGWMQACQVGSGNTSPTNTDTALDSYVAGTTTKPNIVSDIQSSAPYYASTTTTYRFGEGDAAGNISEVGVGTAASGGTLFSRALVTDGGGSPTTITVLSDEFLEVSYQLQLIPPTGDVTATVDDDGPAGTSHDITLRASEVDRDGASGPGWSILAGSGSQGIVELSTGSNVQAFTGAIGTIAEAPAGTAASVTSVSNDTYVGGSYERTATMTFDLDDANFDIQSIRFKFVNGGTWQVEFDPVIPKTNLLRLEVGVTVTWARATAL